MAELLLLFCIFLTVLCVIMAFQLSNRAKVVSDRKVRSITKVIFLTSQISALIWVFISYAIAIYSTLVLEQVYTMAELSEPAINTILGVGALKVVENLFEHNNGGLFGISDDVLTKTDPDDTTKA